MSTPARLVSMAATIVLLIAVACSQDSSPPTSPASPLTKTTPAADDVLLFLRFDNSLIDESDYDRPVSFVGTPRYRNGCSDRAVMFEGDEYAFVPGDASLEPAHVTVEVWMSPKQPLTDNSGFHPLVVKYSGNFWNTVDGYDLWYQDSGIGGLGGRVGFGIGTEHGTIRRHASLSTTLLPSRLYHIVGTFDGAYARLYVDGAQVAATAYSEPLAYLGGGIRIGGGVYHSYYGGWQYYRGIIDQVAIYPRAMSAQEILTRYLSCGRHFLNEGGTSGTKDDGSMTEK
jgi:hypothetical protein